MTPAQAQIYREIALRARARGLIQILPPPPPPVRQKNPDGKAGGHWRKGQSIYTPTERAQLKSLSSARSRATRLGRDTWVYKQKIEVIMHTASLRANKTGTPHLVTP